MKVIFLNYLIIIFYLISSSVSYSIERPEIKNLIVHKDKKKIENIEFIKSKGQKVSLNNYKSNPLTVFDLNKQYCEDLIRIYKQKYNLNAFTLRFANVFGPGNSVDKDRGVINKMINKLTIKEITDIICQNSKVSKKQVYNYCC